MARGASTKRGPTAEKDSTGRAKPQSTGAPESSSPANSASISVSATDCKFFVEGVLTEDFWENVWEKQHKVFRNVAGNFFPTYVTVDRFVHAWLHPDRPTSVRSYEYRDTDRTCSRKWSWVRLV